MGTQTDTSLWGRADWEARLTKGDPVIVRWGFGLGFRAEGRGTIAAVFAKSFRVRLTETVPSPYRPHDGWPAGFVLRGIPRIINGREWNEAHCVVPVPDADV